MMKKIFLILILFITMSFTVVNAAYAYRWTVDGENVPQGGESVKNGTVKWIESEEYTGGILLLDHYQGGQLKIDCEGTGLGHTFAIQLIGDNSIIVPNGVGIVANAPIEFIGDGKLTIHAAVPIGSSSVQDANGNISEIGDLSFLDNTTVVITPADDRKMVLEEKQEVAVEEMLSEDLESAEDNFAGEIGVIDQTTYLISITGVVVGLLLLAFASRNLFKKKRT